MRKREVYGAPVLEVQEFRCEAGIALSGNDDDTSATGNITYDPDRDNLNF